MFSLNCLVFFTLCILLDYARTESTRNTGDFGFIGYQGRSNRETSKHVIARRSLPGLPGAPGSAHYRQHYEMQRKKEQWRRNRNYCSMYLPSPDHGTRFCLQDREEEIWTCEIDCFKGYVAGNGQKEMKTVCSTYEGYWKPSKNLFRCDAACDPPCQNGSCVSPNVCACSQGFRGDRCQYAQSLCTFPEPRMALVSYKCTHSEKSTSCTVKCPEGMTLVPDLKEYSCPIEGKWTVQPEPVCKIDCNPPCQNGGECSQVNLNKCICAPGFRGDRCQYSESLCDFRDMKAFLVSYSCRNYPNHTECDLSCPAVMTLNPPEPSTYSCSIDGVWTPSTPPKCEVVCDPPCQNEGECSQLRINECICKSSYRGDRCQYSTKECDFTTLNVPLVSYDCSHGAEFTDCRVRCPEGMALEPEGITSYVCSAHGVWKPSELPTCNVLCNPACQNGGRCSQMNRCICPKGYRGNRCQYSYSMCDFTSFHTPSITYECTHNSEFTECQVFCPHGMSIVPPDSYIYRCTAQGVWTPDTPPTCQ